MFKGHSDIQVIFIHFILCNLLLMIHIVMIKVTSGRMEQDVALMLYRWRKLST